MRHAWYFDPAHADILAQAKDVAAQDIEALERQWLESEAGGLSFEEEDRRSRQILARLAEAGLCDYAVPRGERVFDGRSVCLIRETLGFHSGLADFTFAMQGLGSHPIVLAGNPAQREAYLPDVAEGRRIAAFALTEAQAGSDVSGIATTARRDGDTYILNGGKRFISNAGIADFYIVFARTSPDKHRGLTAFIVPADAPGFSVQKRLRVMAPHPLGILAFEDCRVPVANRLGEEGEGFSIAMGTLDRFRPSVGAAALGMGARALKEAAEHSLRRRQFGLALSRQQAIQFKLAQMETRLEAARLLVFQAAYLKDKSGKNTTREAAMGKLMATEAASYCVDQAVQILGGQGVVSGCVVERLYRESRPLRIYEGTSEIQHLIISRHYLKALKSELDL